MMSLGLFVVEAIKSIIIFLFMVQLVPLLVWVERRAAGFIQDRLGPNRVGPFGLLQLLADAIKFLNKEEFVPQGAIKLFYYFAPIWALVPPVLAFASIPLGPDFILPEFRLFGQNFGPYTVHLQGYSVALGILFILAVSSLSVYSILMAGWASGNKYSLLGALRASSQTISYELVLGIVVATMVLFYGSLDFNEMIVAQRGSFEIEFFQKSFKILFLPNWGIFYQPIAAFLFLAATFAESNRLPFDLPEGEAELVAGFHTEYGGFKFNLFFIGEYGHMMVAAALFVIFFLGGYELPWVSAPEVLSRLSAMGLGLVEAAAVNAVIHFFIFLFKWLFILWLFIHVRWTLPRFRYDQVMDLGWKQMLPWGVFNFLLTIGLMVLFRGL